MKTVPTLKKPVGTTGSWRVQVEGFGEVACLHLKFLTPSTGFYFETSHKYLKGKKVRRHMELLRKGVVCLVEEDDNGKRTGYCGMYPVDAVTLVGPELTARFGEKLANFPA